MHVNKTKRIPLGELIEPCDERNNKRLYGLDDVMGMSITKEIIPTKADLQNNDLSKFLVVNLKEFVYNPRTHGKKIGLGFNNTSKPFIISWNNIAFRVIDEQELLPDYLYMIICRGEWDRNASFRSWGSSTEVFSWTEFTLMEIPFPPLPRRQQYKCLNGGHRFSKKIKSPPALPTLQPALLPVRCPECKSKFCIPLPNEWRT